jgi:hypothetical protein
MISVAVALLPLAAKWCSAIPGPILRPGEGSDMFRGLAVRHGGMGKLKF